MKPWIWILPLAALAGCNDRDKTDVQLNAAVAFASAREALSTSWNSMSREAAKITADASQKTLEEARKQAADIQARLSKVEIKNPFDQAQMDVAKRQLEKVEATFELKNLQEQSKETVDKAIASGQIVRQSYEDASKRLAEIDTDYRALREKLDAAQGTYEQASNLLQSALQRASELVGSK